MDFKNQLITNILPFWLNSGAIDYEKGGIFTCLDKKGNVYGEDKSVWFQGRALWVFSKAYNLIDKNPEYLKACKCIYDFMPKCEDTDGRLYFTVTREGKGIQKRRYYFSETFFAIGCAEYYRAIGDETALLNARKYFDIAYDCYTGKIYCPPKTNPETTITKALSPAMIMLSTAQVMRACDIENSERYSKICKDLLSEVIKGGYLKENALLESVTIDGKFVDTPNGRVVNPGHSMETAWFVMLEGMITNDNEAIEYGKKIIDITMPLGLDKKHGGIIAFTDVNGKPAIQLEADMKLWWPQCETMIACYLAYQLFNDKKYLNYYNKLLKYVKKDFIDKTDGEWYGYLHYNNTPSTTLKGNIFKGPFHIPRFYMIMETLTSGKSLVDYIK